MSAPQHPPGTVLGSYRLDEVIGRGGMGIVYVATHVKLGRRVAIKVLRAEYNQDPDALRRFFGEARAVNQIAHPNIIEITDFVEQPGSDNYYVMELLEGGTLADVLEAGGVPQLARSVSIMEQVAEALAAVHRAGIVHRDLKPQNIVLVERGGRQDFVKLVDFGIAFLDAGTRAVAGDEPASAVSFGTPRYMSPEQAAGKAIDSRSDIYSFGVLFYELLTGKAPIAAEISPPSTLSNIPHDIPDSLDALIMECLEKDPERRPRRIEDVADRLDTVNDELHEEKMRRASEPSVPAADFNDMSGRLDVGDETNRLDILAMADKLTAELGDAGEQTRIHVAVAPPVRRARWPWIAAVVGVIAMIAIVIVVTRGGASAGNGSGSASGSAPSAADEKRKKVAAEVELADAQLKAGKLVEAGGALEHLVKAREIDPADPSVTERLGVIARKFEQLADQAIASRSYPEAATHLQTVLLAEPDNKAAARRLAEVEQKVIELQRKHK
jgi:hypothetical protein